MLRQETAHRALSKERGLDRCLLRLRASYDHCQTGVQTQSVDVAHFAAIVRLSAYSPGARSTIPIRGTLSSPSPSCEATTWQVTAPPMMLIPCLSAFRIHTLGVDCVRKMASQSILHVVCVCINRIGTVDSVTAPRLCARCVQGAAINSPGPAFAVAATLGAPVGKGIAEAKLAIHPSCASGTRFAWSANSGQSAGFQ